MKKIAIIGGGISGLYFANILNSEKKFEYKIFENCGARLELPGCSLCMGNQARVEEGSVVFSTSTRNFDNRLGKNAQVFLGSAELAAVCALLGRIPEVEEYQDITKNKINPYSDELYRYLQFDEIQDFSLSK